MEANSRMKPKIQILFCGGTMVMVPDKMGHLRSPSAENALEMLLNFEPRLKEILAIRRRGVLGATPPLEKRLGVKCVRPLSD